MKKCLASFYSGKFYSCYNSITQKVQCWLEPLLHLIIRLWIAKVFFASGLVKIDNWDATIYLFENMYKVPFLSPVMSAYMATFIELVCPVFLVLGLFGRLSVIPMLAMTAIIEMNYSDPADTIQHFYWAILMCVILVQGPGRLSVDHWLTGCSKCK